MECAYDALVKSILPNGRYFEENATVHNLSASGVFLTVNRLIIEGQILFLKIAFSSFPFNMQRLRAAPAGSALELNGLNQFVTFGSA